VISRASGPPTLRAVEIIFGGPDKITARTKEYKDRFMSPVVAAERGYIDEVIMARSTRRIARALAILRSKKSERLWKKNGQVQRSPQSARAEQFEDTSQLLSES
jgi:hypothetical protein